MTKAVLVLASLSLLAFACSSSGDDTANSPDSTTDDASKAGRDGGSVDATPSLDASAVDASLPPLPPAFAQCATCMQMTCEPEIAACGADPYCVQLLTCAIESGCLTSDGSSGSTCVSTCATSLGLTPKQVVQETKLLESMATSCASCIAQCPKPDGGIDSGK